TKGEKGFTLIELIVVIAVLGILATLVVPRVVGVKADAEDKAGKANLKIVKNALERYYAENGEYPDTLADLTPNYLEAEPKKPNGDDYSYDPDSNDDGTKDDYELN
ncbi:MAG: type pilus assembly protein PilA, partial [Thermosediminibacterales bacterium]|nr:type pilus assembly protein PilA [Thermosediminibacterales bacterium]